MLVNATNLDLVFRGFQATCTDAYLAAEVHWDKIAMTVNSAGSEETYGWLGQFPQLREWIGPRHIHALTAHGFVRARLDRMTFHQIEADVARAFPEDRRVRKSAIHAWWQKQTRRS